MSQLQQLFVAGVRFDTEIQYQCQKPRQRHALGILESRYVSLPVKLPHAQGCRVLEQGVKHDDGGILCVLQCAAILCRRSLLDMPDMPDLTLLLPPKVNSACCEPGDLIQWLLRCEPGLQVNWLTQPAGQPSTSSSKIGTSALGKAVLDVIRRHGMAAVQLASDRGCHWSSVIGVEFDLESDQVRALLLLDSKASEPWACAHNGRLELQRLRKSSGPLRCRYLTGEVASVRVTGLLTVQP